MLGSSFSDVAIPLVAVLTLSATAFQTSLLPVAEAVSWLSISLFAGVWMDRMPRRRVLIAADLLRVVTLLAIPVPHLVGGLSMGLLYGIMFIVGWGSVFFQIGYQSYLPTLVHRDDLVRANARLGATYTVGSSAGPAAAAALITAFGAPIVVLADAISFFVSAAAMLAIRTRETVAPDGVASGNVLQGMRDRWLCVWRTVVLRAIPVTNSTFFFAAGITTGISTVFQVRIPGLSPLEIGIIAAVGGVGGTLGTLATAPIAKRLSILNSVRVSALCRAFLLAGIPLSAVDKSLGFEVMLASRFALGFAWSVFSVSQLTARQTAVRPGMLSNVTAINNFLTRGLSPIGSLVGGLLSLALGVTPALVVGAVVGGIAGLLVLLPARMPAEATT